MAYTPINWTEDTYLDAPNFAHMDEGIEEAASTADTAEWAILTHATQSNPHSGSASTSALNSHTSASNPHSGSASTSALNSHTNDDSVHAGWTWSNDFGVGPSSFPDGLSYTVMDGQSADGPGGFGDFLVLTIRGPNAATTVQLAWQAAGGDTVPVFSRRGETNSTWDDWSSLH